MTRVSLCVCRYMKCCVCVCVCVFAGTKARVFKTLCVLQKPRGLKEHFLAGNKLSGDVGEIRFLEWRQGSVRVPCILPSWLAHLLWDMLSGGDAELRACMCGEGPHVLRAIEMDG